MRGTRRGYWPRELHEEVRRLILPSRFIRTESQLSEHAQLTAVEGGGGWGDVGIRRTAKVQQRLGVGVQLVLTQPRRDHAVLHKHQVAAPAHVGIVVWGKRGW